MKLSIDLILYTRATLDLDDDELRLNIDHLALNYTKLM